jgi:hypothetical protein
MTTKGNLIFLPPEWIDTPELEAALARVLAKNPGALTIYSDGGDISPWKLHCRFMASLQDELGWDPERLAYVACGIADLY